MKSPKTLEQGTFGPLQVSTAGRSRPHVKSPRWAKWWACYASGPEPTALRMAPTQASREAWESALSMRSWSVPWLTYVGAWVSRAAGTVGSSRGDGAGGRPSRRRVGRGRQL